MRLRKTNRALMVSVDIYLKALEEFLMLGAHVRGSQRLWSAALTLGMAEATPMQTLDVCGRHHYCC